MRVIAEMAVVPLGVGVSLSPFVARVVATIRGSGLTIEEHSMGTNIEGEWDEVMALLKRCHEVLQDAGAPRISTSLKLSVRLDREQSMAGKRRSLEGQIEGLDQEPVCE